MRQPLELFGPSQVLSGLETARRGWTGALALLFFEVLVYASPLFGLTIA